MTPQTLQTCLKLLAGMLSPSQEWNEAQNSLYTFAIHEWADDVALRACQWAALNEKWRPAPVDLRTIAAKQTATAPPASALLAEVRKLILWHGKSAGKAAHSSPFIALIADEMGGWDCMGKLDTIEMERSFPGAVERATRDYHAQIGETLLCLPAHKRQAAKMLNGKPADGLPVFPVVVYPPRPALSKEVRLAIEEVRRTRQRESRPPVIRSRAEMENALHETATGMEVSR